MITRRRIAQALIVVALASVFLPWFDGVSGSGSGIAQTSGTLTLFGCVAGLGLSQYGVRAAWMAPAFAAAVMWRDVIRAGDIAGVDVAFGLWIGGVAATLAAALLIVDYLAAIRRPSE